MKNKTLSKPLPKAFPKLSMEEQDLQWYFCEAEFQVGLQSNYCAMVQKMAPHLSVSNDSKKNNVLRYQTEFNQSDNAASRLRLIHSIFTKLSLTNQRVLELYFEPTQIVKEFGYGLKLVPFTKIGKKLFKTKEPYNKYLTQLQKEVDQLYRTALNEYMQISLED